MTHDLKATFDTKYLESK